MGVGLAWHRACKSGAWHPALRLLLVPRDQLNPASPLCGGEGRPWVLLAKLKGIFFVVVGSGLCRGGWFKLLSICIYCSGKLKSFLLLSTPSGFLSVFPSETCVH